ncbi:MAG: oxygen-dependent coproporphyrinogen oxidase [Pseudomonadota bacterium]
MPTTVPTADQKVMAADWFATLRDMICARFEALEDALADESEAPLRDRPAGRFTQKPWERTDQVTGEPGGGGTMSVMHGRVFEKVGVNISTVHGTFAPEFRQNITGAGDTGEFWASGISLVAHMHSPLVPAVHMNTRHIVTSVGWFGGGADMTPTFPDADDTAAFHGGLKAACDRHHPNYYPSYKAWCDRYFYLPHRNEPRGVGGIFYDQLDTGDWAADFAFTKDVGQCFLDIYPPIVERHMHKPWRDDQRQALREKRGRYAEFNLLYDRGTLFGLKTGGNIDAILMSLPPDTAWP